MPEIETPFEVFAWLYLQGFGFHLMLYLVFWCTGFAKFMNQIKD